MSNTKLMNTRYYLKTEHGFSLCKKSVEELLKCYRYELLKSNKGERVQVIEQKQYAIVGENTGFNEDNVIFTFVVG